MIDESVMEKINDIANVPPTKLLTKKSKFLQHIYLDNFGDFDKCGDFMLFYIEKYIVLKYCKMEIL